MNRATDAIVEQAEETEQQLIDMIRSEAATQDMPVIIARLATGFYDKTQFLHAATACVRSCKTQEEYDDALAVLQAFNSGRHPQRRHPVYRRDRSRKELVYATEAVGLHVIKLGCTKHLKSRIAAIQTCCPVEVRLLGVMPGNRSDELALHNRFEHCRRHGEWFEATPELRAEVSAWKA